MYAKRVALTGGRDRIGIYQAMHHMDFAVPSSRAPRALRGDTLRSALRELSSGEDLTGQRCTESTLRSALPLAHALPEPALADDEPPPAALRPDELARWLQGRG